MLRALGSCLNISASGNSIRRTAIPDSLSDRAPRLLFSYTAQWLLLSFTGVGPSACSSTGKFPHALSPTDHASNFQGPQSLRLVFTWHTPIVYF